MEPWILKLNLVIFIQNLLFVSHLGMNLLSCPELKFNSISNIYNFKVHLYSKEMLNANQQFLHGNGVLFKF